MARANHPISALGSVLFAVGVGLASAAVIHPAEPGRLAASILVCLGLAAVLGLYLYLFQPRALAGTTRLLLLACVVVGWIAAAQAFLAVSPPEDGRRYLVYVFPVAAAPMLLASLLDAGVGVVTAVVLGVLTAFVSASAPEVRPALAMRPFDPLQMASVFLLGGLVGAAALRRVDRTSRYLGAAGLVAATSLIALLAFWLIGGPRRGVDVFWILVAAGLGGLLSAIIALGATVILGLAFGITTRQQLMGMAQLSHPLLRQLQEQAPGTFHHSVIVGNLAERAADLIGADALLVRVGCYFHDIGKSAKPAFYIENQTGGENPYDKLGPEESAKMIAEHVLAGVELARSHRVPEAVRAFIPEHHGTRLITYFYRKAVAADPEVDAEKFRYPGPRPQSRETAIVMLADSVEAIVRSSRDRSEERIISLVKAVLAERLAEGQLDECDLTMRDLATIADSFSSTLRGVYHARVEYPAPTGAEKSIVAAALSAPAPLAGPMDGASPPELR